MKIGDKEITRRDLLFGSTATAAGAYLIYTGRDGGDGGDRDGYDVKSRSSPELKNLHHEEILFTEFNTYNSKDLAQLAEKLVFAYSGFFTDAELKQPKSLIDTNLDTKILKTNADKNNFFIRTLITLLIEHEKRKVPDLSAFDQNENDLQRVNRLKHIMNKMKFQIQQSGIPFTNKENVTKPIQGLAKEYQVLFDKLEEALEAYIDKNFKLNPSYYSEWQF